MTETYLINGEYKNLTMDQLHNQFEKLIHKECWIVNSKIEAGWFDYNDIHQEMLGAFLEAMDTYDITKGHFSTHLTWALKAKSKEMIQFVTADKRNERTHRDFYEEEENVCTDTTGLGEGYWSRQGLETIVNTLKMRDREKLLTLYMSDCVGVETVAKELDVKRDSVYKMAYEYKKTLRREIPRIEGYEHLEVVM